MHQYWMPDVTKPDLGLPELVITTEVLAIALSLSSKGTLEARLFSLRCTEII